MASTVIRELRRSGRVLAAAAGRPAPGGAVILGYHGVRADATGYHVTPAAFARQLGQVRRSGATFVRLAEIGERLEQGRSVDGLAAVTFDDGFAELAGEARRVLEDLAVPATVFVVITDAGDHPRWWPGEAPTLDPDGVARLAASPLIDIGSHTHGHRSLPTLDDAALADELARSRDQLASWTGQPIDLFAYPSGHHDPRVRAAVVSAGYRAACTFRNGRVIDGHDRFRLPRMAMDHRHGFVRWADHLYRAPDDWIEPQPDVEYAPDGP